MRSTFAFQDGLEAIIALAYQPDVVLAGRTAVVIDLDVFRQGAREFTLSGAIQSADDMNTRALQLFQAILMPSYLRELS
jgi:hypothetical protein